MRATLWLPNEQTESVPLVVAGHGFMLDRHVPFPVDLPKRLTSRGLAVVAMDAPGHGERTPPGLTANEAFRAHWREHGATQVAEEHKSLIASIADRRDIDVSRRAWWGLSLETQYGVGVIAANGGYRCAVLGLSGLPDPGPRIARYAAGVTCPVTFIQQLDDEIASRDQADALFDALGTRDKEKIANTGAHTEVPEAAFERATEFIDIHLCVD